MSKDGKVTVGDLAKFMWEEREKFDDRGTKMKISRAIASLVRFFEKNKSLSEITTRLYFEKNKNGMRSYELVNEYIDKLNRKNQPKPKMKFYE